jgi:hypothetical protein
LLVTQEDVQVYAATFNGDPGHQQGSVAVTDAGTVIAWPEGHVVSWREKYSTSAESLSTLTNSAEPTIGAGSHHAYNRYFRNPVNGDMWQVGRGEEYNGYLRKWNDTTKQWSNKSGITPIAGYGSGYAASANSVYGEELAFAADGTIYFLVEWSDGGTGYPRRDATIIKSIDDGESWTTMTNNPITLPLAPGESHVALSSPNAIRNVVQSRLILDNNDQPVVIAAYRTNVENNRSLYYSRWIPGNDRFEYQKIFTYNTNVNIGNVSAMSYNDHMYILLSGRDEHADPNWTTTSPYTAWVDKAPLYLLESTTNGASWNRYTLDDGLGADAFWGGYFDTESLRIDGQFRIMPTCGTTFSKSQIWSFFI